MIIYNFKTYDEKIYFKLEMTNSFRNYFNDEFIKDRIERGLNEFISIYNQSKLFKDPDGYISYLMVLERHGTLNNYLRIKTEEIIENCQKPLWEFQSGKELSDYFTRRYIFNAISDSLNLSNIYKSEAV